MASNENEDTGTPARDLSGWGRFPRQQCHLTRPRSIQDLTAAVAGKSMIARGMGRAYGDSAVNQALTIDMRALNRMISFDEGTGHLIAEAGVVLGDIIDTFLPRGWFPPVTPGTKFVTLGGMIAADVHGKNHHIDGGFGNFVDWVDVLDGDGKIQRCSRVENAELFNWTIGGMGLTGVVIRAAIQLRRINTAWIRQQTEVGVDLKSTMDIFDKKTDWQYSVAWIDCLAAGSALGRSLVMLGDHADISELDGDKASEPFHAPRARAISVPFDAPAWLLNRVTMGLFNRAYFQIGAHKSASTLVDWDSYFYPLDRILNWNRLYGKKGFMQFQCVLPLAKSYDGLQAILTKMAESKRGTFLSVLKRLGPEERPFSFPMEGYTLCLDFPVNTKTLALLTELDRITIDHGGRFYLAKDSRMSREMFQKSDPRAEAFSAWRVNRRVEDVFSSNQSERLGL